MPHVHRKGLLPKSRFEHSRYSVAPGETATNYSREAAAGKISPPQETLLAGYIPAAASRLRSPRFFHSPLRARLGLERIDRFVESQTVGPLRYCSESLQVTVALPEGVRLGVLGDDEFGR